MSEPLGTARADRDVTAAALKHTRPQELLNYARNVVDFARFCCLPPAGTRS